MKTNLIRILALLTAGLLATTTLVRADPKNLDAPNHGRMITGLEPRAEVLLRPDRKIQITFVDKDGQPVSAAGQVVTVTTGDRLHPTQLTFTTSGTVLVSDRVAPPGNNLPTVVQITPSAGAKAIIERFNLNLSTCSECGQAEYACSCDH